LHAELVVVAVKVIDALCDDFALKILPWPMSDAIASIYTLLVACRLSAQIGVPGFATRTSGLRQCLTLTIRAFQASKISALAGASACDKESHVW